LARLFIYAALEWGGYKPEDGDKGYFIMLRGRYKTSEEGFLQIQQADPVTGKSDSEWLLKEITLNGDVLTVKDSEKQTLTYERATTAADHKNAKITHEDSSFPFGEGAFGVKLGEKISNYSTKGSVRESQIFFTNSISIDPPNPYKHLDKYEASVTPITEKIYSIEASKEFGEISDLRREFAHIKKIIEMKAGKEMLDGFPPRKDDGLPKIGFSKGSRFYMIVSPNCTIHLSKEESGGDGFLNAPTRGTISVSYDDALLTDRAKDEWEKKRAMKYTKEPF
jgi:hypothetical protein